jgi:hypothetical protein
VVVVELRTGRNGQPAASASADCGVQNAPGWPRSMLRESKQPGFDFRATLYGVGDLFGLYLCMTIPGPRKHIDDIISLYSVVEVGWPDDNDCDLHLHHLLSGRSQGSGSFLPNDI